MKKSHHVLSALILGGIFASSFGSKLQAQTQTYDRKVYPATMCQVQPDWNEGAGAINATPFLTGAEQISPSAPPISIVLVCPLVRDNVSNTNGILINVYVKDTDPVYSVGCSAISATPYQDTWTQTTVVDSGSTFTGGNKTLLLPILTPLYNNGPINVVCTITGQNTTLFGYSVREYSPSDNEP
jgi:hypothetical protein